MSGTWSFHGIRARRLVGFLILVIIYTRASPIRPRMYLFFFPDLPTRATACADPEGGGSGPPVKNTNI